MASGPRWDASTSWRSGGTTAVPGPNITLDRQFPTPALLVEATFADIGMRKHYHVKRDGMPSRMLLLLEPTFNKIARSTKFRYLVNHGADSNTHIIVVCSWLRPL